MQKYSLLDIPPQCWGSLNNTLTSGLYKNFLLYYDPRIYIIRGHKGLCNDMHTLVSLNGVIALKLLIEGDFGPWKITCPFSTPILVEKTSSRMIIVGISGFDQSLEFTRWYLYGKEDTKLSLRNPIPLVLDGSRSTNKGYLKSIKNFFGSTDLINICNLFYKWI